MGKKKVETDKDKEISYFIEDANLFALWFLSSPRFHTQSYLGMGEISPMSDWDYKRVFSFLRKRFEMAGVAFPRIGSYNDTPEHELQLPPSKDEMKDYSAKDKERIIAASKKFTADDFGLKEYDLLVPIKYNLLRWMYVEPEFSTEDTKKMMGQIDGYIDQFLGNELFVYDRNYLTFERQKQVFIERVKKMSAFENYGENFIISSSEKDDASKNSGFLFVHTLYALQKLKYIGVMRLWSERNDMGRERTFYANIVAFDPFIEEINSSFRKDNPDKVFEGYDDKKHLLKFAGKEVELSKGKKETDAVLLIKTLKKEPDRYWHNDEIIEDWGYHSHDETSKNKAYFAARKINEVVRAATGVEDFIDHNTTKFRINPKYLKVDE